MALDCRGINRGKCKACDCEEFVLEDLIKCSQDVYEDLCKQELADVLLWTYLVHSYSTDNCVVRL